jgi:hypothetical protein
MPLGMVTSTGDFLSCQLLNWGNARCKIDAFIEVGLIPSKFAPNGILHEHLARVPEE